MTRVKICGLRTVEDARAAWQCGADLLGFIFVPASPRCVTPDTAATIAAALCREGCRAALVGVFVNEDAATVRSVAGQCLLDYVQLCGDETPDYVQALGLPAIVARRVHDAVPWYELAAYPAWAYLLDGEVRGQYGGTGTTWPWQRLDKHGSARMIVAGGLMPDNVRQAIRVARPWGVDVASGVESTPGVKDVDKMAAFIRRVREEDERGAQG